MRATKTNPIKALKRLIITYLMLLVYSFFFYTNAQASSSKHNLQIINVNSENNIYIHRSNNDGRAGTYNKDGKTKGISEGCLLILPNQWNKFVKQLSSATNMKLRLIR